jgi:hypothetical protein
VKISERPSPTCFASIVTSMHCAPNFSAARFLISRVAHRGGVDRFLVCPR